jgi:ribosomal protein S18 acetylase RimI-like enzyme
VPDADRESIEHFVRVTLGCRCPDEVFESIIVQPDSGGTAVVPLTRLVVGHRLLIYAAQADATTATSDDFADLAERGRADRDTHGLNRFRLVVTADRDAPSGEAARSGFAQAAVGDGRMHLHVLSPEALPASLRPSGAARPPCVRGQDVHTTIEFRPATPGDAGAAVPLIYSSGPAAFDYVFKVPDRATALEFLHQAFVNGAGEFGYRNHVVAVERGEVVAAGAAWTGASNLVFAIAAARQILGAYGPVAGLGVMSRGLRVESVVQPPPKNRLYVAHLGVRPELRSRGIGVALIRQLINSGRKPDVEVAALDVAVTNPRAQALYERLGFVVTRERASRLANAQATVSNHRRMELQLTVS